MPTACQALQCLSFLPLALVEILPTATTSSWTGTAPGESGSSLEEELVLSGDAPVCTGAGVSSGRTTVCAPTIPVEMKNPRINTLYMITSSSLSKVLTQNRELLLGFRDV